MHTSSFNVLLIEDDDYKLSAVSEFIQAEWPEALVGCARSLNSAIAEVVSRPYHLAIVDMSLPTYDLLASKHGSGTPQGYAGEDILRFIEAESPATCTIVLTQLSEFSDGSGTKSLSELTKSLRAELGPGYRGLVYYSGRHGDWRGTLKELVAQIRGDT